MHVRARIPAIDDRACVPEGPARDRVGTGDTLCHDLDEVELVGRVMVDSTTEEGEEDEEDGAGN